MMPADLTKKAIEQWLPMFQVGMLEFFERYDMRCSCRLCTAGSSAR